MQQYSATNGVCFQIGCFVTAGKDISIVPETERIRIISVDSHAVYMLHVDKLW